MNKKNYTESLKKLCKGYFILGALTVLGILFYFGLESFMSKFGILTPQMSVFLKTLKPILFIFISIIYTIAGLVGFKAVFLNHKIHIKNNKDKYIQQYKDEIKYIESL